MCRCLVTACRVISVPDNFLQVAVVTADGQNITGVRVDEDTFTIQIRDYNDNFHTFLKSSLKKLDKQWGKSPMPSYKDKLTAAEIEDLVSYLSAQRGGR